MRERPPAALPSLAAIADQKTRRTSPQIRLHTNNQQTYYPA